MKQNKTILTINAGSSSLKFSLFLLPKFESIAFGNIQAIGFPNCELTLKLINKKQILKLPNFSYEKAINYALESLIKNKVINSLNNISAVGHRVVNGGQIFDKSIIFTKENLKNLVKLNDIAPLHNPINLKGYENFKKFLPNIKHIAVFDTSFHTTLSPEFFLFPINKKYFLDKKIRRYGAHGTSYRYIVKKALKYFKKPKLNLIIAHIGAGASMCAVKENKSFATSMGLSPLGGLMMGTRSGDLDPTVVQYISRIEKISIDETIKLLNNDSGIKGVGGLESGDMRLLISKIDKKDKWANICFNLYIRRIADYIGQFYIALDGKVDAIILTAGIGENSKLLHARLSKLLTNPLDIKFDINLECYKKEIVELSTKNSKIKFLIIPTNEELVIAQDTYNLITK